jgi:hypothetical protein
LFFYLTTSNYCAYSSKSSINEKNLGIIKNNIKNNKSKKGEEKEEEREQKDEEKGQKDETLQKTLTCNNPNFNCSQSSKILNSIRNAFSPCKCRKAQRKGGQSTTTTKTSLVKEQITSIPHRDVLENLEENDKLKKPDETLVLGHHQSTPDEEDPVSKLKMGNNSIKSVKKVNSSNEVGVVDEFCKEKHLSR